MDDRKNLPDTQTLNPVIRAEPPCRVLQKRCCTTSLNLDDRNPRLTRDGKYDSPREIIQYLFQHEDTTQVAQSIATRGFFASEPLLVIKQGNVYVVLEGNRRLAALKALLKPDLLDGASKKVIDKLVAKAGDRDFSRVPVVIAPGRRQTDKLLAGRHIGTPVKAWDAANRAAFILEKIEEGYDAKELKDELGLTLPSRNVPLSRVIQSTQGERHDEDNAGALHARIQARSGAAG